MILDELAIVESSSEIFRQGKRRDAVGYETVAAPDNEALPDGSVKLLIDRRSGNLCTHRERTRCEPCDHYFGGPQRTSRRFYDLEIEKGRIREELKKTGQRIKPVEVERQLKPLRKSNEALQTITDLEAAGAKVTYRRVDMAQTQLVKDLVADLISEFGTIQYAIHGAGVEESRLISDKDDDAFHRVFDGKAMGGLALVQALPEDCVFVSMGSVAGRFGNPGQVDYSAANDALARICLGRPQSLHVDWTAWDNVGMAIQAE